MAHRAGFEPTTARFVVGCAPECCAIIDQRPSAQHARRSTSSCKSSWLHAPDLNLRGYERSPLGALVTGPSNGQSVRGKTRTHCRSAASQAAQDDRVRDKPGFVRPFNSTNTPSICLVFPGPTQLASIWQVRRATIPFQSPQITPIRLAACPRVTSPAP